MISSTDLRSDAIHIVLQGRLDLQLSADLRQLFQRSRDRGMKLFLLSADQVEYIDSSGLSALISGLKAARQVGGELVLIEPSPAVRKLLDLTLLDRVIPLAASLGAALPSASA